MPSLPTPVLTALALPEKVKILPSPQKTSQSFPSDAVPETRAGMPVKAMSGTRTPPE